MWIKKTIAALVLSASAVSSHAAPAWFWSMDVKFIISDIGGTVQVQFFKDGVSYKPCAGVEYYTYQYEGNNSAADRGRDTMTSSLLTAYASKRKASAIIDCDNNTLHGVMLGDLSE